MESSYLDYTTPRRNKSIRGGAYLCLVSWLTFLAYALLFPSEQLVQPALLSTLWFGLPVAATIVLSKVPGKEWAARNLTVATNMVTGLVTVLYLGLFHKDLTLMTSIITVLVFFLNLVAFVPQPWAASMTLVYFIPCFLVLVFVAWSGEQGNFQAATVLAIPGWVLATAGSYRLERLEREGFLLHHRLMGANRALAEKSSMDPLTNLLNRRAFFEQLEFRLLEAKQSEIPFALAMVDLDHFKNINDTYGHPVGDSALVDFAHLMRQSLRTTDLAARYGGEEFIVVLELSELATAMETLDRLRSSVGTHNFSGVDRRVTCSIGVTLSSVSDSTDTLIKRADAKLYLAKQQGRDQVQG